MMKLRDFKIFPAHYLIRGLRPSAFALGLALLMGAVPGILAQSEPAQVAGSKICATCHEDIANQFVTTVHARLADFELHEHAEGCEACHGNGSRHIDSSDSKDILSYKELDIRKVEQQCQSCHADRVGRMWNHSEHSLHGVSCVQCHKLHQSREPIPAVRGILEKPAMNAFRIKAPPRRASLLKPESELCTQCHKDVGAKMMYASHHPVREGRMTCTSCHAVHGSEVAGLKSAERSNDLCLNCHAAKQGPFIFDHEPVSESCAGCHVPHGSVNNSLLKQNEPFLCLQCHESHFHMGRAGVSGTVNTLAGGSTNPFGESGWRRAFGTKCTQCHTKIHGSDLPSQSITGGGKALIR